MMATELIYQCMLSDNLKVAERVNGFVCHLVGQASPADYVQRARNVAAIYQFIFKQSPCTDSLISIVKSSDDISIRVHWHRLIELTRLARSFAV
jgi:hypothetical protein